MRRNIFPWEPEYVNFRKRFQPELISSNWEKLVTLLSHSPFETSVWKESQLHPEHGKNIEIGPRTAVKTAACTNILSIFESSGIKNVERIERGIRYLVEDDVDVNEFFEIAADKMTGELLRTLQKIED